MMTTHCDTADRRAGRRFYSVLFLAQLLFFLPLALQRLIARDEGFYVIAAKAVMHGDIPYLEFFYPQMPLLPYVYGIWFLIAGYSFEAARVLSALLACGTGMMICAYLTKRYGKLAGVAGIVLFCTSSFTYPWLLTAQTYSLSLFLLFMAFFILSKRRIFFLNIFLLSGFVFGLSVNTRLFFAGLLPFFLIYIWQTESERKIKLQSILYFLTGMGLTFIPHLFFILHDFDVYYFNNLGYHLSRSAKAFDAELKHKFKILRVLLGFDVSKKFHGFQFALLFYISSFYLLVKLKSIFSVEAALFLAYLVFALSLLPSPAYVQYFCITVPFFVIAAVSAIKEFEHKLLSSTSDTHKKLRRRAHLLVSGAALFALYLWNTPLDMHKYTQSGEGVIGIGNAKNAKDWRLSRISEVAAKIDMLSDEDSKVFSWWPGYLVSTRAKNFPGTENHFATLAAQRVNPEKAEAYKLLSKQDQRELISKGEFDLLVLHKRNLNKRMKTSLKAGAYQKVDSIGRVLFFAQTASVDKSHSN